jgi:hypothetical protein
VRRPAVSWALAAAIGLIALSLMSGAAIASSSGPTGAPKSLTHHFPLGTQTLSRTNTAPAGGSATARRSTGSPHRRRTQPERRLGGHSVGSILVLLVIPVLVVVALLSRVAIRKSRRTVPRVKRRPLRLTRSTAGARWAYVDKDDVERKPPPLPLRRPGK